MQTFCTKGDSQGQKFKEVEDSRVKIRIQLTIRTLCTKEKAQMKTLGLSQDRVHILLQTFTQSSEPKKLAIKVVCQE